MGTATQWRDDGEGFELITPEHFLPAPRIPEADRRMGIDQWTGDAGLITFAASLDPSRRAHRVTAWVLLVAISSPALLVVWSLLAR